MLPLLLYIITAIYNCNKLIAIYLRKISKNAQSTVAFRISKIYIKFDIKGRL